MNSKREQYLESKLKYFLFSFFRRKAALKPSTTIELPPFVELFKQ